MDTAPYTFYRHLLDEYLAYGGYPEVVLSEPSQKFGILKNHYDIFVYLGIYKMGWY